MKDVRIKLQKIDPLPLCPKNLRTTSNPSSPLTERILRNFMIKKIKFIATNSVDVHT